MLSDDQTNTLVLLRDLSRSSLARSEQAAYVTLINEAIVKLEDAVAEAELLGGASAADASFVQLAWRRLVAAQRASLGRFDERRRARTARLYGADADLNVPASPPSADTLAADSEEDVARGVREAKSESITKVLQRMHEMAQAEILKGELNISELDMSSRTLRELQEKYFGVDMLLNGSKQLVKMLDEADKWDRRCMQASLGFLAAVLVYIIYRRILSGPVKILLWSLFQFLGIIRWAVPTQDGAAAPLASPMAAQQGFSGGPQGTLADLISTVSESARAAAVPTPETAWVVSKAAVSEAAVSEAQEPEAAEPEAAEPEAAEPEAAEPEAAEPEAAEPEAAEPEAAEPEAAEPDAAEPEAAEPEVAEPEAAVPKATEPESQIPQTLIPGEALSSSAPPGTAAAGADAATTEREVNYIEHSEL